MASPALNRRYLTTWLVVGLIAVGCLFAGVWQWQRLFEKHHANTELRGNDHAATAQVGEVLRLAGSSGAAGAAKDAELREVSATGTYDSAAQVYVRSVTVDSEVGFYVLVPFTTPDGTVLVVRGFVEADANATNTPSVSPAPSGVVTIRARVQPADTKPDRAAELPPTQVDSVNPVDTATRLGQPVYDGYVELLAGQPGTNDVVVIPAPDLSNPAGGAVEPQHLAYVIQWFLFAALALGAPFLLARADAKRDSERSIPLTGEQQPTESSQPPTESDNAQTRRAKVLANRYGR